MMKNFNKIVGILILIYGTINAQDQVGIIGTNNWLRNWTEFNLKEVHYNESTHILAGDITEDVTLFKKNTYVLIGDVYITNGAILSIEPGTVILGDSKSHATLTITKGAGIIAEGTETNPIIFSSNASTKKAGDWGGLIVLGNAPTNKLGSNLLSKQYSNIKPADIVKTNFGGNNASDNSGVIKYVRVEYAGRRFHKFISSNSILLAGIGNKTEINNVMVSYSGGNAVKVMGGNIDMHSMVSYKSKGNDYEFNYGAKSNIHNLLAIRSPFIYDRNGSRCISVLSFNKEEEIDFSKKGTQVLAKNITLLTDSKSLESDIKMGLIKEAVFIGNNTQFELSNSVISGFKYAIIIDEKTNTTNENLAKIKLSNMYFNNCSSNIALQYDSNNKDIEDWYRNPMYDNMYARINHTEIFNNLNLNTPDYRLRSNTHMVYNNK